MQINEWIPDFEKGEHFSSLFIASRNSGKSYLCRYLLLYKLRDKFDLSVIFCTNKQERDKYEQILETELSFDRYIPELVRDLVNTNEKRESEGKPKLDILIVMDDTVGNNIKNDDEMLQTYTNGRHNGLTIMYITQSMTLANTHWRNNSDYIFLFKQNSTQHRNTVRDNLLLGSADTEYETSAQEKRAYNDMMKRYMSKKGDCLVLDLRGVTDEQLYRFRAPEGLE